MVSLLNDVRIRSGDAPGLTDFGLAYAARAKSVRFDLALIVLLDVYEMTNILGSLLPFRLPKSKPFIPKYLRVNEY